jgi:hypothetical protein
MHFNEEHMIFSGLIFTITFFYRAILIIVVVFFIAQAGLQILAPLLFEENIQKRSMGKFASNAQGHCWLSHRPLSFWQCIIHKDKYLNGLSDGNNIQQRIANITCAWYLKSLMFYIS